MKKYLLLLLTISIFPIFPQDDGDNLGWMEMEIFMMTTGLGQGETVRYKLEAIGTVWRSESTLPPSGYQISNSHNLAYYPVLTKPATGNTDFNNYSTIWGFNWIKPFITYSQSYDSIAHGLYKVSISPGDQYFYLDYRDDRYNWSDVYRLSPGNLDIWILYNKVLNKFMYRGQGSTNPNPQYWTQVQKGDCVGLWDVKQVSDPTTDLFPDFWINCLSVFNDGNGHPKFAWGPHPGFTNSYYKIYKKKGTPDFILYDITDSRNYVDLNENIITGLPHANEGSVQYKITSVGYPIDNPQSPPLESGFTNAVDIRVIMPPLEKVLSNQELNQDYSLFQNYPNPFNSSTTITYTLIKSSIVSLKIYDVLGKEVLTLVNEFIEKGTHSIEFNLPDLPSGIYLYKFQSEHFVESRKLVLLK